MTKPTSTGKYYSLSNKTLVDEKGREFDYYRFQLMDKKVGDEPWLHGVAFSPKGAKPIKVRVDPKQKSGGFPDFASGPIPLISDRLKKIFIAQGVKNIIYSEIDQIDRKEFTTPPSYFAIAIVGTASLLDNKGNIRVHSTLDIFRSEQGLATIFVSEKIKSACVKAGIETLKFSLLEK